MRQPSHLPMSREEMTALGWNALDVLLVSGDAYVDHPSFGVALLGRWLVHHGFRVGICAQPHWNNREQALEDISRMGRPLLFAGVTAGAIDSMLAHYTAFRKKRRDDAYTPGGLAGARPNRATIAYTGLVRQAFPGIPVVLGGIEASLRRISHYDFWSDSLRRSLLLDSKADLLIYGMGEKALLSITRTARELERRSLGHVDRHVLTGACLDTPGLAVVVPGLGADDKSHGTGIQKLPSHEAIQDDPALLMQATLAVEQQVHREGPALEQDADHKTIRVTPPAPALLPGELDELYLLPYSRKPHPSYSKPIPAWEMIRTSITTHRGCGGGCSFCSLALHQGRRVASRTRDSVLEEAGHIAVTTGSGGKPPRWAGSISDVGGPSANMWQAECSLPREKTCSRPSCLYPAPCPFFQVDQRAGVRLLRDIASLPGIRHVRVASGVRFDLALRDDEALKAYTSEFTGGQLKVAPEHCADSVLALMRKPSLAVFERFLDAFARQAGKAGKELYTVPYLMSAHPGCTMEDMRALAAWLARRNWSPRQVQCFIPTPGTVATAMFYGGIDAKGSPLYIARTDRERLEQHRLLTGSLPATNDGGRHREKQPQTQRTSRKQNKHLRKNRD